MLRSMTGYGKAITELDKLTLTIEIKTLNSKQFDLICRMPQAYNEKEPYIRSELSQFLRRGKTTLNISRELRGEASEHTVNKAVAMKYFRELRELKEKTGQDTEPDYLQTIMRLPEVMQLTEQTLEEREYNELRSALRKALEDVDSYRKAEGKILSEDFQRRINTILDALKEIESCEEERLDHVKEKFHKALADFREDKTLDENRYEQEIVYYLDKLDITEEKVRLKQHCYYFLETMTAGTANGKKLNFIAQEIGREINTMGSKANHSGIQKIVVDMKDELEKIKEQLSNIL
ncbi:MAG: YicC/YloC family endoribonuclease [Bacteroidales bacterium]